MRRVTLSLMLAIIALLSLALSYLLLMPVPTTEALDNDLAEVRLQLKEASDESEKYSLGALKSLIELRRSTLENTESMLAQKRASIIWRINLSYSINTQVTPVSGLNEVAEISKEIDQAEHKLAESKAKAQEYSSGLLQALALMSMETDALSVSQLKLKFYATKYGLPLFELAKRRHPKETPGTIVRDKDAL